MIFKGKSELSLNELTLLGIKYEGDGWVTGYPIIEGETAYILNGVVEVDSEYITIREWVPVFKDSLKPIAPSLTDDQQVVLEWLTENIHLGTLPFNQISLLNQSFFNSPIDTSDKYIKAFGDLDSQEQFQVLAAFAEWGMANA